jgi:hypothetical protein
MSAHKLPLASVRFGEVPRSQCSTIRYAGNRMTIRNFLFGAALLFAGTVLAAGVDPMTAEIDASDAIRFALV